MLVAAALSHSSTFPADFKEQVRSRTDLVSLVGESVSLTPRGPHDHVGLCPFHDDHNPSFHVYPDRQAYRCWVCDEGGDCFSYVMKTDRIGFREALEQLAERANLEMPKGFAPRSPEDKDRRSRLLEILAWAEQKFHQCLLSGKAGERSRSYLADRGISQDSIKAFRLGCHPDEWTWLLDQANGMRYKADELFQAKLIKERQTGGYYDAFVDRVMFPVRDMRGRPVAFCARILPDSQRNQDAKYLNSDESEFFTKSKLVYGFEQARDAIRKTGTVLVMEGNTDVILAHQYGLTNAVATLGTSLTESHVTFLKRFARQVVLVFDGDEAGQKSTRRAIDKFLTQEVDLRILTLPDGLDPADYLSQHGAEAFGRLIENATEAWEKKFQLAATEFGVDSVDGRQRILDLMLEAIAAVPNFAGSSRETVLISRLSGRLMIDERAVRQQLAEKRKPQNQKPSYQQGPEQPPAPKLFDLNKTGDLVEAEILEILLSKPSLVETLQQQVSAESMTNPVLRTVLQFAFDVWERGEDPTFARLMAEMEDPQLKNVILQIDDLAQQKKIAQKLTPVENPGEGGEKIVYLDEVVRRLHLHHEKQRFESLKGQLVQSPTPSAKDGPTTAGELNQEHLRYLLEAQKFHAKRANS